MLLLSPHFGTLVTVGNASKFSLFSLFSFSSLSPSHLLPPHHAPQSLFLFLEAGPLSFFQLKQVFSRSLYPLLSFKPNHLHFKMRLSYAISFVLSLFFVVSSAAPIPSRANKLVERKGGRFGGGAAAGGVSRPLVLRFRSLDSACEVESRLLRSLLHFLDYKQRQRIRKRWERGCWKGYRRFFSFRCHFYLTPADV